VSALGGPARGGILVSQTLRAMVERGEIQASRPLAAGQIQPSSIDLRLGGRIWQLQCSFLPGTVGVAGKIRRFATALLRDDPDAEDATSSRAELGAQVPLPWTTAHGVEDAVVLHHGSVYLAELEESLALPGDVWGRANPKSSTGRLDVFVRVLTERGEAFDTIPAGYQGKLYLEITPQSFHVAVRRGDCLSQLRLGRGDPTVPAEALRAWQAARPLCIWSDGAPAPVTHAPTPALLLSVDLASHDRGPVGFVARRHQPPIDLARRDLPVDRYWTPLRETPERDEVLEPEQFYILATREHLVIPPELCAELVAFDATKGELRTHYAGFIDSGFGLGVGVDGLPGARLVLEIRTHDVPFLLEHGQALFRLEMLYNEAIPDSLYGAEGVNNYQGQGLKLAKQFGGR
jgi:dCTP deaminase